ncbi:hypothetical protein ANN_25041 [Periplaneta americana]|uniref:Mariner Mos1 transposase n=1 Tax=Periplaneta americana TaxID=6978 RepID=A0ABQ8S0B2_PERAM|nr:hypothetical protein ANN_25041 [Periplaneta americana]
MAGLCEGGNEPPGSLKAIILEYILVEFPEPGETINAVRYIHTLMKLRRALREKRPERKIILQHDKARRHIALVTMEKIRIVGWKTLLEFPYSPDLARSDYYLFGSLKEQLRGQRYVNVFRKLEWTSIARKF